MSAQAELEQFADEPTAEPACRRTGKYRTLRADSAHARAHDNCSDCYPDGVDTRFVVIPARADGKCHKSIDHGTVSRSGCGGDNTDIARDIFEHEAVECFDVARVMVRRARRGFRPRQKIVDDVLKHDDDRGQLHAPEYVMFGTLAFLAIVCLTVLAVMGGGF